MYEPHSALFQSAPGLLWKAYLKKTGIKLELLTEVNTLLIIEKGIMSGISHVIHKYVEANNIYMKKL